MANKTKAKKTASNSKTKKMQKAVKKPVKSMAKKATQKSAKKVIKKTAAKKVVKKVVKKAVKKTLKNVTSKKAVKKVASQPAAKQTTPKFATPSKKSIKIIDYSKAFTPLADRLVIRVRQGEKVTAGGIIIPDTVSAVAGHIEGEVLAVGHGAKNKKGQVRPLDVQVGDVVVFSEYSGTKIEFNSEELQIIKETDVMGIVQK